MSPAVRALRGATTVDSDTSEQIMARTVALLEQMFERNGVDHAILIQMQHQFDNDYQYACVRRYPGRFAPVVVIDAAHPDAPQELARQAALGASGVRLQPTVRSLD